MDYTLLSIVSHIILLFSQYSPVSEVQVFLFKLRCFLVEAITRGLDFHNFLLVILFALFLAPSNPFPKHFRCINPFNSHNNSVLLLFLVFR